jgi:hypothetical protein
MSLLVDEGERRSYEHFMRTRVLAGKNRQERRFGCI